MILQARLTCHDQLTPWRTPAPPQLCRQCRRSALTTWSSWSLAVALEWKQVKWWMAWHTSFKLEVFFFYQPRVKELGQPPFSYQNRSPNLRSLNCRPMMQAKVGPTRLPGRGRSESPPDQRSMSSGVLKTISFAKSVKFETLRCWKQNKQLKVYSTGCQQNYEVFSYWVWSENSEFDHLKAR